MSSEPRGPVYLTLPREVARRPSSLALHARIQPATRPVWPTLPPLPKRPISWQRRTSSRDHGQSRSEQGRRRGTGELAERFAFPVVCHVPKSLCLASDHPMHMGFRPRRFVNEADAILVLECDVPWIPNQVSPGPDAKMIHMGIDPIFARYGIRNFPWRSCGAGDPGLALPMLAQTLSSGVQDQGRSDRTAAGVTWRTSRPNSCCASTLVCRDHERTTYPSGAAQPRHRRIKDDDTILINELGVQIDHMG